MKYPIRFIPALLWLMFGIIPAIVLAQGQEIWFAPPAAPVGSRLNRAVDLMDLFKPDAPWQKAASHIKVFKLYGKGRPRTQPGCQSSIDQILELIKVPLSVYTEQFPNIVIGDTEPTDIAEQLHWKEDVSAWANGFRRATGHSLAFMHLDIPYSPPR